MPQQPAGVAPPPDATPTVTSFDPNQPFQIDKTPMVASFDPTKPFEVVSKPPPITGVKPTMGGFLSAAGELGGMMAGPELVGPLKGAQFLGETGMAPTLVQMGKRIGAAAVGAMTGKTAGSIAGGLGPPPAAEILHAGEQGMQGEMTGQMVKPAWETGKAVVGAVGSVAAKPVLSAGRSLVNTLAGPPTAEGIEATSLVGKQNITAAQQRNSPTLEGAEKFVRGSLFSGGLNNTVARGRQAVEDAATALLNKVGPATTPEDAGKTFQQAQELAHQTAKAQSKAAYQRVDQLGRDVRVSTTSLTDFANAESNRRGSLGMDLAGGKTPQMIRKIQLAGEVPDETNIGYLKSAQASAQGERTVAAMGGRPAQVLQDALTEAGVSLPDMEQGLTFSQAHEVRAAFGRIQRAAKFSPAETARQDYGIATQFKNRIDSAMTTAAGGKETPLRQAYDEATSGYKQMADTYQRGLLAKVAKQTPDVVVNSIVKPGRVDDITKARDAVGPKGWQGVQYAQAQKLLTNSTGGIVSGDELTKRLTKLRPETLNAVYPNGEAEEFQKLGRVMQQLTKGTPSGYLEMRIEIGQGIALAGTAAGMLTGHVSPEAAAQTAGSIVLVPAMLGRILMSAQPRKALMDGLEATAGNNPGRAARAAGQLTAWLVNQGLASTTPSSGPPPSAPTPQPTAPSQGRGGGAGPMTGAPANRIPMGSPIYGPPPKQ